MDEASTHPPRRRRTIAPPARTDKAAVEGLWLEDFRTHLDAVFVMDIETVNRALIDNGAAAVDGVVGAGVLLHSNAIIDYAEATLYPRRDR